MKQLQLAHTPIDETTLTPRQQAVLAHARANPDGITKQDAGQALHELKNCRHCTPDQPCRYARHDGLTVLAALKRHGLIVERRRNGQRWHATTGTTNPQTNQIPF